MQITFSGPPGTLSPPPTPHVLRDYLTFSRSWAADPTNEMERLVETLRWRYGVARGRRGDVLAE